jgi:hypothetical protein
MLVQSLRVNASPQCQGTGHLHNPPHDGRARKGGLDIPATHAGCDSLHSEHPNQSLPHHAWSRTGRIGVFVFHAIAGSLNDDRLPVMH